MTKSAIVFPFSIRSLTPVLFIVLLLLARSSQAQIDYYFPTCPENTYLFSDVQGDGFGRFVIGGSDINNDSIPDFFTSNGSLALRIYSGADLSLLYPNTPLNYSASVRTVDTLGDINNDNFGDYIIASAIWYDSTATVTVYGVGLIVSGQDHSIIDYVTLDSVSSWFANTVACIGDINNDDINDFAVGGATGNTAPFADTGKVIVYDGATFNEIHTFVGSPVHQDGFGARVIGPGDLDNDNVPDIVIADLYYNQIGKIYAYSGSDYSELWSMSYLNTTYQQPGYNMAGIGDINKDDYDDVIIGTYSARKVFVVSGLDGSMIYQFDGDSVANAGDYYGRDVGRGGDLNHDGYPDFAIGDASLPSNANRGGLWIFSGLDSSQILITGGDGQNGQFFGDDFLIPGDLDDDGTDDVILATDRFRNAEHTTGSGTVLVKYCLYPDSNCTGGQDTDGDYWDDQCDNCVFFKNTTQVDYDSNGVGDACQFSWPVSPGTDVKALTSIYGDITFDSVSVDGNLELLFSPDAPTMDPGLVVLPSSGPPKYSYFSTDVVYEGNIQICLYYDPADVIDEDSVKLYHYDNTGNWVDITASVDTAYNRVCGTTDHLSPFAVTISDALLGVERVESPTLPVAFALAQNYPNPFNPSTTIQFSIATRSAVSLDIFNLLGQKVATLHDGDMSPGVYSVMWDGRSSDGEQVASGIYLYRLQAGDVVESRKMILLK